MNLLTEVQNLCEQYDLQPTKKLGQNFLIDQEVLEEIVSTAQIKKSDYVVEVGPGFGVLTRELASRAKKVLAVEMDDRAVLAISKLSDIYQNIQVVSKNILTIKNAELLELLGSKKYRVIANIPYQITSRLLRKFLSYDPKPQDLLILVQKEVAQRVVAPDGQHSLLSLSVQFYGQPEIKTIVPSSCFWPEPAIDSALLSIKISDQYLEKLKKIKLSEQDFWSLVRASFAGRRKTLVNNLSNSWHCDKPEVIKILKGLGIGEMARAQDLSLDQWLSLATEVYE